MKGSNNLARSPFKQDSSSSNDDLVYSRSPSRSYLQSQSLYKTTSPYGVKSSIRKDSVSRVERMLQELARMFMDNIYLEKEVEKLKLELSVRADFTNEEAWNVFNYDRLK